ncbi:glycosyltransferase family 2 protein [Chloroflexota bacterium]
MKQTNTMTYTLIQPKVSIIIVNWNGKPDTAKCLMSLREINYSNFKVIIVDNGSRDDSIKYFKKNFPEVMLIENKENLGLTGAFNAGIKKSLHEGTDYILCLNNDTVVDVNFLKELVMAGEKTKDIGGLCPKEYDYHNPNMIVFAGGKIGLIRSINYGYGEIDIGQYSQVGETKTLCGAAMMLKSKALLDIGFFDADYFFNWEDKDISVRLMRKGYKLMYVPKAKFWHKGRGSTGGKVTQLKIYFASRNHILFAKKNYRQCSSFIVLLYLLFVAIPYLLWRSVQSRNNYVEPVVMAFKWHINHNSVPQDAKMVELMARKQKSQ